MCCLETEQFSGGKSLRHWSPPTRGFHSCPSIIRNNRRQTQNPSKSLKKTAFEAKGLQYNTDKVRESQRLFNVDLYAYLAIYRYG